MRREIFIILAGIFLIILLTIIIFGQENVGETGVGEGGGGGGIYASESLPGQLFKTQAECQSAINAISNPQPCKLATDEQMIKDPQFMETNWNTATEPQKIEYISKRTGIEVTGNPGKFRLNEDGSMTHINNNFKIESDVVKSFSSIEFDGEIITAQTQTSTWIIDSNIGKILKFTNAPLDDVQLGNSNYDENNPANAPARAFGEGGGSGGGGGGEQMMQLLQQLLEAMKEMRSNGKGETRVEEGKDGKLIAKMNKGAALSLEDDGNPELLINQKYRDKEAELKEKGDKEADITKANIIIPEQLAASVDDKTKLILNGIDGDDPNNHAQTYSGPVTRLSGDTFATIATISLNPSLSPHLLEIPKTEFKEYPSLLGITGKQVLDVAGQSIELNEHNLILNGHEIDTYALKTFNNLDGGGQNLIFFSGNFETKFHNQQTLISRTLPKIPYGVKKISNKLDRNSENTYNLQHYENAKGEFKNTNEKVQRVSFSDITINPKSDTYSNLIIWEGRENMWRV